MDLLASFPAGKKQQKHRDIEAGDGSSQECNRPVHTSSIAFVLSGLRGFVKWRIAKPVGCQVEAQKISKSSCHGPWMVHDGSMGVHRISNTYRTDSDSLTLKWTCPSL